MLIFSKRNTTISKKNRKGGSRGLLPLSYIAVVVVAMIFGLGLLFSGGCESDEATNSALDSELHVIDDLIKERPTLNRRHEEKFNQLRELYLRSSGNKKIDRGIELADEYRLFNADSSLYYSSQSVDLALKSHNQDLLAMARAARATTLGTLGLFTEGEHELNEVAQCQPMTPALKEKYFYAGRTLYGYLIAYLNENSDFLKTVRAKYRQYDDSLISVLPEKSTLRQFLIGEKYATEGNYEAAMRQEMALLKSLPSNTRLYAMTAFQLAMAYRVQGDQERMAIYLAKAAAADLRSGIRDGLALPMLATYLYKAGDVDQAYRYVNISLQEAANGGIKWRASLVSQIVPSIDEAYHDKMTAFQNKLVVYAGIITLIMIGAAVLLYMVYRQHKQLHAQALLLEKKAWLQTSYIGNFISMCASYADRLNSLTSMVDRKLAAGEIESLKKMLKSGKFTEAEDADFYRIFDSAFLDIYPDFVSGLNELLKEDERISWKEGNPLTPELRIYALVRLGVNESTRIAQVLHYSVSTVYAYRNRMRNRAQNRDEFEKQVTRVSAQKIAPD